MTSASSLLRTLLIYVICLPLAVFVGYVLASDNPMNYGTFAGVGVVLFFLAVPLLLRWHHAALVIFWNTTMVFFFIPGSPQLWMLLGGMSLLFSILQVILSPRAKFLHAPQVARPLLLLAVVVLATAKLTGGFGLAMLGSEVAGGKRYVFLLAGIIGFFAFTARRIQPRHAWVFVILFFLGTMTQSIGELASVVSPSFYFLFVVFPVSSLNLMVHDSGSGGGLIARLVGFSLLSTGIFCAILVRYGVKDMLTLRRPFVFLVFLGFIALSMLGGYRSILIMFVVTLAILFYMEGLVRTALLPILVLVGILGLSLAVPFATRLPSNMQRSLSFLPIPIDPAVKMDAETSSEWRLNMWRNVLPQIPQHLILGKGLGIRSEEADRAALASRAGGPNATDETELMSDFHNGPLSVIIPFGMFGAIAFLWFLGASLGVLYKNYKFGPAAYSRINRFMFAYFLAKAILFFLVFGNLYSDIAAFTGLIGLSISLNGGVAKPLARPVPKMRLVPIKFRPVAPRPIGPAVGQS